MPNRIAPLAGEGEKGQVRRVEHELDAHEDHQRVAPNHHAEHSDAEKKRSEKEVVLGGNHVLRSELWRPPPRREWRPIAAARPLRTAEGRWYRRARPAPRAFRTKTAGRRSAVFAAAVARSRPPEPREAPRSTLRRSAARISSPERRSPPRRVRAA